MRTVEELLNDLRAEREVCWRNPNQLTCERAIAECPLTMADIEDAAARLVRFASYFRAAFPETLPTGGIVESPLREIPHMKAELEREHGLSVPGSLWLKMDSHLAVSGSIKARGGVYEVLKVAEDIALKHGLLQPGDDYSMFASPAFQKLFSEYSIAVGSTGNLGLSIGIMSAKLGFRVTVHMSADARQWKKDLLRSKGVEVVEYRSDYSEAVKQGRALAQDDPMCHFVDDENSKTLFLGYSVAALRLKEQLKQAGIAVDGEHPLMVYLPCGVGGGPGGVAFGLKQVFGDAVHCFFAEPVRACCMLLGMATGLHNGISVQELGIDGRTVADGLAVGRASGFVGRLMEPFMSGCYTLSDERMHRMLTQLADAEDIWLEPSALAGMYGPVLLQTDPEYAEYRNADNATHLVWATGGSMVPQEEMRKYYRAGKSA
ncbi:MAG: D-serine ammonia-lyase [Oscillospiraceae bacterium]|nr:D-serine ammonia-lyase [Oscillospiraceae bacterium]